MEPYIMFFGNMRVGGTVKVQCSVHHTCPTDPPTLSLNMAIERQHLSHRWLSDGTYTTTLMATMLIGRDHQTVECSAQHFGGLTARASKALNAKCT